MSGVTDPRHSWGAYEYYSNMRVQQQYTLSSKSA